MAKKKTYPMIDEREIQRLAHRMKDGGVILYPTETVWGLGCDALQEQAVERIYELKNRPKDKRVLLLLDSLAHLREYIERVPPKASSLIEYHERPLTIVYDNPQNLPDYLLSEDGSIAIRITRDPFCKALVKELNRPLVSTSANLSGQQPARSYKELDRQLVEGADAVAYYRREEVSEQPPSQIVRIDAKGDLEFIRK